MTSPAPARTPAVVVVDLLGGIVALICAGILALGDVLQFSEYSALGSHCVQKGCSTQGLSVVIVAGTAIVILGFALALGMVIVRGLQRRWVWRWPVVVFIVIVLATFAVPFGVGAWANSVGGIGK